MKLNSYIFPLLIFAIITQHQVNYVSGQFPEVANAIWGPNSIVRGVKNVIGGVLAMDGVHSKCAQKTMCSEFADEIVEASAELDPVKRTWVYVPRVVQRKGRLRWIGDMIANTVGRVSRRLGLHPDNRRQGGGGLVGAAISFAASRFSEIPFESMMHVMDFVADVSNTMDRNGAVYPFVRAGTLGYGYGHRRSDDLPDGVCAQIAEDCGSWWGHLETVNNYDGGSMSRRVAQNTGEALQRDGEGGVSDNQWNFMKPDDILQPRVFLCKAGRFLDGLNGQMGGDEAPKEKFGNDDFQRSCDPKDLDQVGVVEVGEDDEEEEEYNNDNLVDEDGDYGTPTEDPGLVDVPLDEIQIIEAKGDEASVQSLPILVFEGLPEPRLDQTEEDLVESILTRSVKLPRASVRTALRLPMLQSNGKALTVVEMDTKEHERTVLTEKDVIRKTRLPDLDKVGIRRAKYKELWKLLEEIMVAKRVVANNDETGDEEEQVTTTEAVTFSNDKDNAVLQEGLFDRGVTAKVSIKVEEDKKNPK